MITKEQKLNRMEKYCDDIKCGDCAIRGYCEDRGIFRGEALEVEVDKAYDLVMDTVDKASPQIVFEVGEEVCVGKELAVVIWVSGNVEVAYKNGGTDVFEKEELKKTGNKVEWFC